VLLAVKVSVLLLGVLLGVERWPSRRWQDRMPTN